MSEKRQAFKKCIERLGRRAECQPQRQRRRAERLDQGPAETGDRNKRENVLAALRPHDAFEGVAGRWS